MQNKKTEQEIKEVLEETAKTYTSNEVEALLDKQKSELRENAVKILQEKNAEIKNELIQSGSDDFYNIAKWEVMKRMATDMIQSGALPKSDNAYTVMMKMQAGREMGLKPIESIKSFYIVNGIINIYGDAVIRRLREHGWALRPYIEVPNSCKATISKGKEKYTETFTFEEAQKSGWTKTPTGTLKPGWLEGINRRRKLRYGAISNLIKTYVPEVLGSAIDIAEVAEDTVPLYTKTNGANGTTLTTPEDASKPATLAQRNILKTPDNENLTFGEAVEKIRELTAKK